MFYIKKFSICFSEWVFDKYLITFKGNRSRYIESMFVSGVEHELVDNKDYKTKILEGNIKIRSLEEENSKLKSENGLLKEKLSGKHKQTELERFAKAYKNKGLASL